MMGKGVARPSLWESPHVAIFALRARSGGRDRVAASGACIRRMDEARAAMARHVARFATALVKVGMPE
jgi:hypothetical protein